MPVDAVRNEISNLPSGLSFDDTVTQIAERFDVSRQAMSIHLQELKYLLPKLVEASRKKKSVGSP